MTGKNVTRLDLYEAVYQTAGLSRAESLAMVELVLNEITDTLAKGESVKLSSFGSFIVRNKKQRVGRNPKASASSPSPPLIDDLVRRHQKCLRHDQSQRPRGLKVDDKVYIVRLLDGYIGRTRTLENLVDGYRGIPPGFRGVRTIRQKTPSPSEVGKTRNRRNFLRCRHPREFRKMVKKLGRREQNKRLDPRAARRPECVGEIVSPIHRNSVMLQPE
ncbi:HU family DNA-binding protein [Bradyrhizobium sp. AUGA SZCCT0182]|nr:HU family DNA-binding protein [Bradyrhizobium sp. AUGA SZCCT0182]